MSNLVITGLSKLERDGWGRPIPFGADATNIYLTSSLKIAGRNCYTAQDAINAIQYGFTLGNASRTDILTNHSAVVAGQLIDGTMPNRGLLTWTPTKGTTKTVASGYYSGGTLDSRTAYNNGYNAGTTAGRNNYRDNTNKTMWYNVRTTTVEGHPSNAYMLVTSGSAFNGYINSTVGFNGTWAFTDNGAFRMNYDGFDYNHTADHRNDFLIFNVPIQDYTNYWVIMKHSRYDNGSHDAGDQTMIPNNGIAMTCYGDGLDIGRFGSHASNGQLPHDNDTSLKHVVTHEFWVKAGDINQHTLHLKFFGCRYGASYVIVGIK